MGRLAGMLAGLLCAAARLLPAGRREWVAGILAATSRRSPVATVSLAVGTLTGLASGLLTYEVVIAMGDNGALPLIVVAMACVLGAAPAGMAAAWLLSGTDDPQELRAARIRQGLLAGAVAGAVAGILLTLIFVLAFFMLVVGPLAGAATGAVAGAFAAEHPRRSRPDGSRAAGLFVSNS